MKCDVDISKDLFAISMMFFFFEGTEERVLAWRTEPLRCEIHFREVSIEVRVIWKAPRATVGQMFDVIDKAAASMNWRTSDILL